jgi:hypothetical protein
MIRKLTSFGLVGLLGLWMLIVGMAGAAGSLKSSTTPATEQVICVGVRCGGQGQIDQPHRATLTVTDSNGNSQDVTIYFQPQTHIDAIVGLLVEFVSFRCGIPIGPAGLHTSETTHPHFRDSEEGRASAEDIHIPSTHKITKIKVEIYSGNTWNGASHLTVSVGGQEAGSGIVPMGLAFFECGLEPYVANPLAVELELEGVRPDGVAFTASYHQTFSASATVAEINQAIKVWAVRRGMLVTNPDPQTLRFTPDPQRIVLTSVWLTFFQDSADASVPGSMVEWRFDCQ